jgi:thioredoxin 1
MRTLSITILVVTLAVAGLTVAAGSGILPIGGATRPTAPPPDAAAPLPTLIELYSDDCIPCLQMKPILRKLESDYAGKLRIVRINVDTQPDIAEPYDVYMIPTQVFLSAEGKELFRHEGFFSRREILEKWRSLGIALR